MARIRTIKPETFKNEDLARLPFECRYAFIGLWTQADREGRLKDRPTRLRADLFPYDAAFDMDAVLTTLAAAEDPETGGPAFIRRYVVDGIPLIQIVNFTKHQKPHPKEPHSTLPGCTATSREETRPDVKRNGEPGNSVAHPGSTAMHSGKDTADQVDLGREGDLGEGNATPPPPINGVVFTNGQLHHAAVALIGLWNAMARPPLVAVSERPASMTRIFQALRSRPSLDDWSACLTRVAASDYLCGRVAGHNGRPFRADFWWSLTHYDEIVSGRYDNAPSVVMPMNGHEPVQKHKTAAETKAMIRGMKPEALRG